MVYMFDILKCHHVDSVVAVIALPVIMADEDDDDYDDAESLSFVLWNIKLKGNSIYIKINK